MNEKNKDTVLDSSNIIGNNRPLNSSSSSSDTAE
jgi:hypothetical protein